MRSAAAVICLAVALAAAASVRAAPGATRGARQGRLGPSAEATNHRFVQAKTIRIGDDPRVDEALECISEAGYQTGVMFMIHAVMRITDSRGNELEKRFCTYNAKKKLTLPDIYEYVQQHACGSEPYASEEQDIMCQGLPPKGTERERNSFERTLADWAPSGVHRVLELATGKKWGSRYTCGEKKAAAVVFATAVGHIGNSLPDVERRSGHVRLEFSTLAISAQSNNVRDCFNAEAYPKHNDRVECLAKVASVAPVMPCGPDARDSPEACCQNFAQDLAEPFATQLTRVAGVEGDRVTVEVRMVNDPDAASTFTATKAGLGASAGALPSTPDSSSPIDDESEIPNV